MLKSRTIIEFFKHKFKFKSYFFILSALCMQFYVLNGHIGITNDSLEYLSAALSFHDSYRLEGHHATAFKAWPPLYPIILSFGATDIILWVSLLHTCMLALTLYVFFRLGKRVGLKAKAETFYQAGLAWGTPFLFPYIYVWSEPLFILLLGLTLYVLLKYFEAPSLRTISILGLLGTLLCMERNAGIFWLLPLCFFAGLWAPAGKKWQFTFIYIIGPAAFFMLWNWQLVTHQPGGEASFEYFEPPKILGNWYHYLDYALAWFLPRFIPVWTRSLLLLAMAALILLGGKPFFSIRSLLPLAKLLIATVVSAVFYIVVLLVITGDAPDDAERLLSVVYPVCMTVLAVLLHRFISPKWHLLFILWLCYPLGRSLYNIDQWRNRAAEFRQKATPVLEHDKETHEVNH